MYLELVAILAITTVASVTCKNKPGAQLKCSKPNELFYSCISPCGDGCDNFRIQKTCSQDCLPGACSCKRPDYFRHPETGNCVQKNSCPTTDEYDYGTTNCTDPNELYTDCGPSCDRDGCVVPRYFAPCEQKCQKGCFCKCGYFRLNDVCVKREACDTSFDNFNYDNVCPFDPPTESPGTRPPTESPVTNPPPVTEPPVTKPPVQCSDSNEVFTRCGSSCGDGE